MLLSQIRQVMILETLLQWWPLILVLTGLEILVYVYTAKEPEPKVKYDVFSMLIVFLVVVCSIGAYAFTAAGIMERICWIVASNNRTVELPSQSVEVDESVKKVVISAPQGSLTVRRNSNQALTAFGYATVNVAGEEEIDVLLKQCRLTTQQEGEILFVQVLSVPWQGDTKPGVREIRRTLLVPSGIDVEINGSHFNLDLDSLAVQENWLIKGNGSVNITLADPADLFVDAQVRDLSQLKGNANWEVEEITSPGDSAHYHGHIKWGEGHKQLKLLLKNGQITLNII